ncbi:hypothetical protein NLI96_g212 [Meripilus lineatus]|uniref:Uncharacterized protein n=1 Tax=Meripilus lineatus TaxID=2056292 RepID=A0AAD5VCM7_9APHY|nr:hypothetical protein NLI96_g212 [Physisporinus lineatus]
MGLDSNLGSWIWTGFFASPVGSRWVGWSVGQLGPVLAVSRNHIITIRPWIPEWSSVEGVGDGESGLGRRGQGSKDDVDLVGMV